MCRWKIIRVAAAVLAFSAGPRAAGAQVDGSAPPNLPPMPYFKLQVLDPVGRGRCLEANAPRSASVLRGATFLDHCQNVTGQAWQAQPTNAGQFRLVSLLHKSVRCLAISAGEVADIPAGTPFMAPCAAEGAVFEAALGGNGRGFQLLTTVGGGEICLTAGQPDAPASRAVPVYARDCGGATAQVWTAAGGRLIDGIPVAARSEAPRIAASANAKPDAECLWNDGASDRPDYFPCRVEATGDGDGFVVVGPGYAHTFAVDPERRDIADGTLRIGGDTIRTGRFQLMTAELNCWQNAKSGERLCIIR